jgi:integrase
MRTERHWTDARLFPLMLSIMFNAVFWQMLMSEKCTKSQFTELGTRKAYALMWGFQQVARRAGDVPWIGEYERYLAATLMSEAGVPPKRAQEILGHADIRTTLAIYTHTLKRKHDDTGNQIAAVAGLSEVGNKWLCKG